MIGKRFGVALFCMSSTLLLPIAFAKPRPIPAPPVNNQSTPVTVTDLLGGHDRYLTNISTDKPIYRVRDKVYVRGVVLHAINHKPHLQGLSVAITVRSPKGEVAAEGRTTTENGVWTFDWPISDGQAGGEYTITARPEGYAPAERKIDIRAFRAPRLNSHITFLRDGYGPGDTVTATLEVKRAEGGAPTGAKVTATPRVDGVALPESTTTVDDKGLCTVTFALPKDIAKGEGTLALAIQDGGVQETASKSIPILVNAVDIQIYPEGGDLVNGFKNRVYVQATQPNGKPADIDATIIAKDADTTGGDTQSRESSFVTTLHTEHEGRGRFEFVPGASKRYYLKVSKPSGIDKLYELPPVKAEGAVITCKSDVHPKGQPITLQVGSTSKNLRVTLSKHDVILATNRLDTTGQQLKSRDKQRDKSGANAKAKSRKSSVNSLDKNDQNLGAPLSEISMIVPPDTDGVLTATVWDQNGVPLAERLIYREQAKPLNISMTMDKQRYIPGENAKVTIKATDADGKPVSAVVGVTVTDESVLQMVEKREQAPRLPVMVLLEPEVKDLADAQVYLDPTNPKAPLATDLLLGTQGWRRFALRDVSKFLQSNDDNARRALAFKVQNSRIVAGRIGEQEVPNFFSPMRDVYWTSRAKPIALFSDDNSPKPKPGQQERKFVNAQPLALLADDNSPKEKTEHEQLEQNNKLPEEIGRVEGPRDINMFQVEPTVIDERYYTSGRAERHQKTSPTLPEGAPIQDSDGDIPIRDNTFVVGHMYVPASAVAVDKYSFHSDYNKTYYGMVREYAHQVRPNRDPNERKDFTETLYWNALVKTDAKTGEGTIAFGLNDSVTTFKVAADGFTDSGSIGAVTQDLKAIQPFYAEAKVPLEVTAGDKIMLPISLINGTTNLLANTDLHIDLTGPLKLLGLMQSSKDIDADKRVRYIQPIDVGTGNGQIDLTLKAKAGVYSDKVTRQLTVKPQGFPIETTFGGTIEPGKRVSLKITIPETVAPQSLSSNTMVYPTPLANLSGALERLIQDPNGCFEQTSSTSYPLTMAQQYFLSHTGVSPKLIEAAREKLDKGYKKLLGYRTTDKGYECFGNDPGHEALTAFGLQHFSDMAQVREVDRKMLETTRAWLMQQRDGQGGFTRKRANVHTWLEDKDCSNAYIVWSLMEIGQNPSELTKELALLKTSANKSQNSYVLGLAANALYLAGDKPAAKQLMQRLASLQNKDGSVDKVQSSIEGSGGNALEIEGTSLATLAWLRDPDYASNVERSIKYLADSCQNGRYGSTQSTVLALRTILAYDKLHARPKAPGKLRIYVDGQAIGDWVAFDKSAQESLKLPNLSEPLTPGNHTIDLEMVGGCAMPYSLAVKYNTLTPVSDKDCVLDLSVKMAQDKVVEGTSTEANVTVENTSKETVPSPIAIIGLPGGLEPRHDQLKELVKKGTIASYEVNGREVILYWRSIDANTKVSVPISLVAAIPGTYTGPASRAYLYYTDEHKDWVAGPRVVIAARE